MVSARERSYQQDLGSAILAIFFFWLLILMESLFVYDRAERGRNLFSTVSIFSVSRLLQALYLPSDHVLCEHSQLGGLSEQQSKSSIDLSLVLKSAW